MKTSVWLSSRRAWREEAPPPALAPQPGPNPRRRSVRRGSGPALDAARGPGPRCRAAPASSPGRAEDSSAGRLASIRTSSDPSQGGLGSGPRHQILSHVFARCASQKTHGHARIARVSPPAAGRDPAAAPLLEGRGGPRPPRLATPSDPAAPRTARCRRARKRRAGSAEALPW